MKKSLFIFITVLSFFSCKKYLDIVPDNVATLDYAFRNRNETENYLFTCYSIYQIMQAPERNPGWTSSGEILMRNDIVSRSFAYTYTANGFWVPYGNLSPYGTSSSTYIQQWFSTIYIAIRRCNTMLENINEPPDLTLDEKNRWIAEVKLLKAWYYFFLVRQYGPIPLVKENMPVFMPTDEARLPRAPSDSIFAYIKELINEALPDLPDQIVDNQNELGRFTKPIALALGAKAAVLQASPLFNGDNDFKSLANADGTKLFPQSFDQSKWDTAVLACRKALDFCEQLGITLYKFTQSSTDNTYIPDTIKQQLSIQAPFNFARSVNSIISEDFWPGNTTNRQQQYFIAFISAAAQANRALDVASSMCSPLSFAELFYSNKGVPISEDLTYNYNGRYGYSVAGTDQQYYIKPGYITANLNMYREPRFYSTLNFDGGIWYGQGVTAATSLQYNIALPGSRFSNLTGYWAKKMVNYQTTLASSATNEVTFFPPVMRLADLQLLYAEAENEANGPSAKVYRYVDSVRMRAGLKGVIQSWQNFSSNPSKPLSKEGMRSIIHQERRIELCYEGEVGWDLKRWKEYLTVNSAAYQGWDNVGTTTPEQYYRVVNKFTPNLTMKNYFWPFPEAVILNNPLIVQNLYW